MKVAIAVALFILSPTSLRPTGIIQDTDINKPEHVLIENLPSKDAWDKAYTVFTGLLVLIGGITFSAVWYQARKTAEAAQAAADSVAAINKQVVIMERQTTATETAAASARVSADAAKLNAQVLINSERAWLIPIKNAVQPNDLPTRLLTVFQTETITVRIKNFGNTPAWIMDWFVEAVTMNDTNISPFTSAGKPEGNFPNSRPFPSDRTEDFSFEWKTNASEISEIRNGQKHLYLYGFLQYRSIAAGEPHESHFCFHYFRQRNADGNFEEGWYQEPADENYYT